MFENRPWRPRIPLDGADPRDEVIKDYMAKLGRSGRDFIPRCLKSFVYEMAKQDLKPYSAEVALQQLFAGSIHTEGGEPLPSQESGQQEVSHPAEQQTPAETSSVPKKPQKKKKKAKAKKESGNGAGGNGSSSQNPFLPGGKIPDAEEFIKEQQERDKKRGAEQGGSKGGQGKKSGSTGGITNFPKM